MNVFHFTMKNANSLVMMFFIIIGLYVSFNLLYVITSPGADSPRVAGGVQGGGVLYGESLPVHVANIQPNENGNVDLVLSLNMKDLVRLLNKMGDPNSDSGEETAHFLPGNITITMHNPDLCRGQKLDWAVYVHSSPANKEKRENLRHTWGNTKLFKYKKFKIVFLVGKQDDANVQKDLEAEFKEYGDIVQGSFQDHYRNLTLKGIMGLEWMSSYCSNAPYVIKADDDAFLNIFELRNMLAKAKNPAKMLACPLWKDNSMPILRDPAKCMKWCVKYNEFPGRKYFPKYCAGLTYVMGMGLLKEMHEAAHKTPFFWIDDVYITGLLPSKVKNIDYIDFLKNFTLKQPLAYQQYVNVSQPISYILAHIKKIDEYKKMWEALLNRLSLTDLKLLGDEVVQSRPELKAKVEAS